MNLNMLSKPGNLICTDADFVKFIYQNIKYLLAAEKKEERNRYMYTKIHTCLGKSEYHNRFFSFALRCTFTFPCLVICRNLRNLFEI